ncbi:EAL domain-containing protein [Rhodococcus fascians]|nr:EAL domain-containing protein [Rhodococcus fascians]MBY4418957.1 EAL domain-containing protein [Rhodococcus fascians]
MHRDASHAQFSPMTIDITSTYQPIVALDGRAVVGYEALVRTCGDAQAISPPQLLREAADRGESAEFDWRCRLSALSGAVEAGFPEGLALFVNAEPTALDAPPPRECLPLMAEASRLSIIVEITERDLMGDPAGLLRAVEHARDLGWRVALDDVGADSSSLALIPLLRPDVIKLDMSLVQGRSSCATASVVSAVAAEAERSGALVLAEGIETEQHEATAHDMGAVLGQGYLYGAPTRLPTFGATGGTANTLELEPAITVRAPVAVTPYGLVHRFGTRRRADARLLDDIENGLLRSVYGTGASTVVLATTNASAGTTAERVALFDDLAVRTALLAVFDSRPMPGEHRFRTVTVGEDEPLASERSVVIVAPMSSVALIAVESGTAHDGSVLYDYCLTYDRHMVLDAATLLLRRLPARTRV